MGGDLNGLVSIRLTLASHLVGIQRKGPRGVKVKLLNMVYCLAEVEIIS